MTRIGLTLVLTLATAASPWLCCCTAGHLFAFCVATKQKPSAGHPCCGDPTTKERAVPSTPSPVPHGPCPCKEKQPEPLVFLAPEHSSAGEQGQSLMAPYGTKAGPLSLTAALPATHGQEPAPRESIPCPSRSSRDILRALHILRC